MMKLIDDLEAKLKIIGASLHEDRDYTLNCDAPSGYVWRANGCACIAIQYATNSQSWLAKALREDGFPRLKMGLQKITDPADIEMYRHDLDDDSWGPPADGPAIIDWPK